MASSTKRTLFGQVVIGPPGSGKTTYCHSMAQYLRQLNRKVAVVNLDPGNDCVPLEVSIDVAKLITVNDVMENLELGVNGASVYSIEYLEMNIDWLFAEIEKFPEHYFLFDFPGQIELYTHHESLRKILNQLEKFGFRLCCVHLVDSHYCSDPGKFISALIVSLSSMLRIELPQVNILSKIDLAEQYGKLQFGLDFYTEVLDLEYLLDAINTDPFMKKYHRFNASIIRIIENYGLVSFFPLSVSNMETIKKVRAAIDQANGYIFGENEERSLINLLSTAIGAQFQSDVDGTLNENFSNENENEESMYE